MCKDVQLRSPRRLNKAPSSAALALAIPTYTPHENILLAHPPRCTAENPKSKPPKHTVTAQRTKKLRRVRGGEGGGEGRGGRGEQNPNSKTQRVRKPVVSGRPTQTQWFSNLYNVFRSSRVEYLELHHFKPNCDLLAKIRPPGVCPSKNRRERTEIDCPTNFALHRPIHTRMPPKHPRHPKIQKWLHVTKIPNTWRRDVFFHSPEGQASRIGCSCRRLRAAWN